MYECAPRVLLKGQGEDGRGDDRCGEVQRRGGGEHAAETVQPIKIAGLLSMCMMTRIAAALAKARPALLLIAPWKLLLKFIKDESESQNDS